MQATIILYIIVVHDIVAHGSIYSSRKNMEKRLLSIIRPRMLMTSEILPNQIFSSETRRLPCCKDETGGSICKNLKRADYKAFTQKCQNEPDFSLVVCCNSCSEAGISYRERAHNFFSKGSNSTNCFDRMSPTYCNRFQTGDDAWSNKRWSCDTSHFRLGFRVCRSTCGFCSMDWLNAPEPKKCL